LVGGTTLVLKGLRAQTVDVDLTWDIDPAQGAKTHRLDFIRPPRISGHDGNP
jgi:hypothetical protein